jgi:hypothetical protein
MRTNDLKKGDRIQLRNGWYATIADNMRGNIRLADVEGDYREIGSVYAHDIVWAQVGGSERQVWVQVEHTPAQEKLRKNVNRILDAQTGIHPF